MLKGLGEIGQVMKLQKEFKDIQKRLQKNEVEGESADGLVKVKMNGEYKAVDLQIDEEALRSPDRRKLEKMILAAYNDAVEKTKKYAAGEMARLTGGMNIPGLGNFFK
jgi:DNA-binding YbaB/EbfC family protein